MSSSQLSHYKALYHAIIRPLCPLQGFTNTVKYCYNQLQSSHSAASQEQTAVTATVALLTAIWSSEHSPNTSDHPDSKLSVYLQRFSFVGCLLIPSNPQNIYIRCLNSTSEILICINGLFSPFYLFKVKIRA